MSKVYSVDLFDYDEHSVFGTFDNEKAAKDLKQYLDAREKKAKLSYTKPHDVEEHIVFSSLEEYLEWEKLTYGPNRF